MAAAFRYLSVGVAYYIYPLIIIWFGWWLIMTMRKRIHHPVITFILIIYTFMAMLSQIAKLAA